MTAKKLLLIIGAVSVVAALAGGGWYFWQMQRPVETPGTQTTDITGQPQSQATTGGGMKAKTTTSMTGPVVSPITTVIMSPSVTGAQATPLAHTTAFPAATQKIHVTVQLPSSTTAKTVTLQINYLKDSSVLGPVSATVKTQDGVTFASFAMTSPPNGWPVGEYKALVGLPTGEAQEVPFSVQ